MSLSSGSSLFSSTLTLAVLLLAILSLVLAPTLQGDYDVFPAIFGCIFGVAGLVLVFTKGQN